MASSSKSKAFPSTAKLTHPLTIDGKEYVPEPPFAEEKAKIWHSQAPPEKSSDNDERPIAQVFLKPSFSGQPCLTDPNVSSHSKKSKKHKRSAATGPEVFLVGLSDLLTRISAYNLSSCLQPPSQPTQPSSQHSHKSKGHQGHKRKKHDSPSRSGEAKKKRHHKVLTPEAPALDADTIVVDTSILNKAPALAVGASQSTSTPAAAVLGEENPEVVPPTPTQVVTCFTIFSIELLDFSYKHLFPYNWLMLLLSHLTLSPTILLRRRLLLQLTHYNLSTLLLPCLCRIQGDQWMSAPLKTNLLKLLLCQLLLLHLPRGWQ
ncbi:uncharacterized protein LOC127135971 [Lathyrus oleraceus]|uniref:uncharacterized protein LOC127135971 n=1 Tax=Pisum sativum TaxID=3888 RepID=UPI0021CE6E34|nr:uncharacterized protein LOC127135971 [Pisum sativum]